MTPREFLTLLWGDPPPGVVNVWTLPTKKSLWYATLERVNGEVAQYRGEEIYTGTSVAVRNGGSFNTRQRISESEAAGIAGIWQDVDISHPQAHAKKSLPPDKKEARRVMGELPLPPTLVVDSGYGLQYWWLFEEPWVFGNDEDRERARRLTQWWHSLVKQAMAGRGWGLDSVFDLARVMRLPGTFNNKVKEEPRPVQPSLEGGPRHSLETLLGMIPGDFEAAAQVEAAPKRNSRNGRKEEEGPITTSTGLVLDPGASPTPARLETLLQLDNKFRRTWERKRSDLADQSASSYDMSVANITLNAGWPEQEAVNAMICWRRTHGEELKLRENYYLRTLAKAREPIRQRREQERLEDALADPPEDQRDVLRSSLAQLFGVDIHRVIKYLGDPPVYYMVTGQGNITIGQIRNIYNQEHFREAVGAATGRVIGAVGKREWENRVQAILNLCEDVDVGDASHPAQETRSWIADYLLDREPRDEEEWEEAAKSRRPFRQDDAVVIFLEDLQKWLEVNRGFGMKPHEAGRRMRQAGCLPRRVNLSVGGRKTTRSCWELPPDLSDQGETESERTPE